eukprot:TRINITY_DN3418_c1_g2_i1.p1 TRINITY_DN3418_c1_g2~~TRINITY_DN3418_c1_g2_i1.p1  ORF type:complete len:2707 (+),score=605.07 TRINITY_DN3418_c1_g2_i1:87-8207(+)
MLTVEDRVTALEESLKIVSCGVQDSQARQEWLDRIQETGESLEDRLKACEIRLDVMSLPCHLEKRLGDMENQVLQLQTCRGEDLGRNIALDIDNGFSYIAADIKRLEAELNEARQSSARDVKDVHDKMIDVTARLEKQLNEGQLPPPAGRLVSQQAKATDGAMTNLKPIAQVIDTAVSVGKEEHLMTDLKSEFEQIIDEHVRDSFERIQERLTAFDRKLAGMNSNMYGNHLESTTRSQELNHLEEQGTTPDGMSYSSSKLHPSSDDEMHEQVEAKKSVLQTSGNLSRTECGIVEDAGSLARPAETLDSRAELTAPLTLKTEELHKRLEPDMQEPSRDMQTLRLQVSELMSNIERTAEHSKSVQQELANLRLSLLTDKDSFESMSHPVQCLHTSLEAAHAQADELSTWQEAMDNEAVRLSQAVNDAAGSALKSKNNCESMAAKISDMYRHVEARVFDPLQVQVPDVKAELDMLAQRTSAMQEDVTNLVSSVLQGHESFQCMSQSVQHLDASLAAALSKASELAEWQQTKDDQVAQLTKSMEDAAILLASKKACESTARKPSNLPDDAETLESDKLQLQVPGLKAELDMTAERMRGLQEDIANLRSSLMPDYESLESMSQSVRRLDVSLAAALASAGEYSKWQETKDKEVAELADIVQATASSAYESKKACESMVTELKTEVARREKDTWPVYEEIAKLRSILLADRESFQSMSQSVECLDRSLAAALLQADELAKWQETKDKEVAELSKAVGNASVSELDATAGRNVDDRLSDMLASSGYEERLSTLEAEIRRQSSELKDRLPHESCLLELCNEMQEQEIKSTPLGARLLATEAQCAELKTQVRDLSSDWQIVFQALESCRESMDVQLSSMCKIDERVFALEGQKAGNSLRGEDTVSHTPEVNAFAPDQSIEEIRHDLQRQQAETAALGAQLSAVDTRGTKLTAHVQNLAADWQSVLQALESCRESMGGQLSSLCKIDERVFALEGQKVGNDLREKKTMPHTPMVPACTCDQNTEELRHDLQKQRAETAALGTQLSAVDTRGIKLTANVQDLSADWKSVLQTLECCRESMDRQLSSMCKIDERVFALEGQIAGNCLRGKDTTKPTAHVQDLSADLQSMLQALESCRESMNGQLSSMCKIDERVFALEGQKAGNGSRGKDTMSHTPEVNASAVDQTIEEIWQDLEQQRAKTAALGAQLSAVDTQGTKLTAHVQDLSADLQTVFQAMESCREGMDGQLSALRKIDKRVSAIEGQKTAFGSREGGSIRHFTEVDETRKLVRAEQEEHCEDADARLVALESKLLLAVKEGSVFKETQELLVARCGEAQEEAEKQIAGVRQELLSAMFTQHDKIEVMSSNFQKELGRWSRAEKRIDDLKDELVLNNSMDADIQLGSGIPELREELLAALAAHRSGLAASMSVPQVVKDLQNRVEFLCADANNQIGTLWQRISEHAAQVSALETKLEVQQQVGQDLASGQLEKQHHQLQQELFTMKPLVLAFQEDMQESSQQSDVVSPVLRAELDRCSAEVEQQMRLAVREELQNVLPNMPNLSKLKEEIGRLLHSSDLSTGSTSNMLAIATDKISSSPGQLDEELLANRPAGVTATTAFATSDERDLPKLQLLESEFTSLSTRMEKLAERLKSAEQSTLVSLDAPQQEVWKTIAMHDWKPLHDRVNELTERVEALAANQCVRLQKELLLRAATVAAESAFTNLPDTYGLQDAVKEQSEITAGTATALKDLTNVYATQEDVEQLRKQLGELLEGELTEKLTKTLREHLLGQMPKVPDVEPLYAQIASLSQRIDDTLKELPKGPKSTEELTLAVGKESSHATTETSDLHSLLEQVNISQQVEAVVDKKMNQLRSELLDGMTSRASAAGATAAQTVLASLSDVPAHAKELTEAHSSDEQLTDALQPEGLGATGNAHDVQAKAGTTTRETATANVFDLHGSTDDTSKLSELGSATQADRLRQLPDRVSALSGADLTEKLTKCLREELLAATLKAPHLELLQERVVSLSQQVAAMVEKQRAQSSQGWSTLKLLEDKLAKLMTLTEELSEGPKSAEKLTNALRDEFLRSTSKVPDLQPMHEKVASLSYRFEALAEKQATQLRAELPDVVRSEASAAGAAAAEAALANLSDVCALRHDVIKLSEIAITTETASSALNDVFASRDEFNELFEFLQATSKATDLQPLYRNMMSLSDRIEALGEKQAAQLRAELPDGLRSEASAAGTTAAEAALANLSDLRALRDDVINLSEIAITTETASKALNDVFASRDEVKELSEFLQATSKAADLQPLREQMMSLSDRIEVLAEKQAASRDEVKQMHSLFQSSATFADALSQQLDKVSQASYEGSSMELRLKALSDATFEQLQAVSAASTEAEHQIFKLHGRVAKLDEQTRLTVGNCTSLGTQITALQEDLASLRRRTEAHSELLDVQSSRRNIVGSTASGPSVRAEGCDLLTNALSLQPTERGPVEDLQQQLVTLKGEMMQRRLEQLQESYERQNRHISQIEETARNASAWSDRFEQRLWHIEQKTQAPEMLENTLAHLARGVMKIAQLLGAASEDVVEKLGWREACSDLSRMVDHAWLRCRLPRRASVLKLLRHKADAEAVRELQQRMDDFLGHEGSGKDLSKRRDGQDSRPQRMRLQQQHQPPEELNQESVFAMLQQLREQLQTQAMEQQEDDVDMLRPLCQSFKMRQIGSGKKKITPGKTCLT